MSLRERLLFLKHYRESFHRTGSITQSSASLARAITSRIAPIRGNASFQVLEVGVGTGAFTREIAKKLRPQDHLVAYEINEGFVEWMHGQLETDPVLAPARDRIEIVHAPIESIERRPVFDFVICSLPFNNFQPELVREIFDTFRAVTKPDGIVSFFEYVGIRPLRSFLASGAERRRLRAVDKILDESLRNHGVRSESVFRNLPPANVHHLCFHPPCFKGDTPLNG